jgi:hypothetical protein
MFQSKDILTVALAAAFLGSAAFAEGEVKVLSANLASGQPVSGKVAIMKDHLLFVDDENLPTSFLLERSNISAANPDGEAITLQLKQPVTDRAGSSTRVILRMNVASDALALASWYNSGRVDGGPSSGSAGSANTLTFSAQRKKRFRSNTDGKLIVDGERMIFESVENASESRRWELKEIREFRQKNPFEVTVTSSGGERYTLTLSGKGMDNSEFREISDRITKARTER